MKLNIYQLNFVIKEIELNKKYEITQQSKPISNDVIIKGNQILLPHFFDIDKYIGNPHAVIEPISENIARYTQIFKTNKTEGITILSTGFWFWRNNKRERIQIKKGEFFDLMTSKNTKKFVGISNTFSLILE